MNHIYKIIQKDQNGSLLLNNLMSANETKNKETGLYDPVSLFFKDYSSNP